MSDADRFSLAYVAESTFGKTPGGPPILQNLRFTSCSFKEEANIIESNEIRDDGQVEDLIRAGVNISGDFGFELSYSTYDDFLAALLRSSGWSSPAIVTPGTGFAVTNAGGGTYDITDSFNGLGSLNVGQWIEIRGFTNAANNGYAKITAAVAGSITVEGNGDGVNEVAGAAVTIIEGAQIVNGNSDNSFVFEGVYEDLSNEFVGWNGITIEGAQMTIAAEQIITGTFSCLGTRESTSSATIGNGSNTAANTNEVMASTEDVLELQEGATLAPISLVSLQLNIANNLRMRREVANLAPVSIGKGRFNVTGTLAIYYPDSTLADKFLNQTITRFAVKIEDPTGNAYIIECPEVKITDAPRVPPGTNQDIMLEAAFTAFRDDSEDITMRITRFVA